jgi:L-lactate dehydrogenase complex protein LldE
MAPGFDKVERLLAGIDGVEFASLDRPDECCGFGGTFTVDEPVISAEMGRDRLADHARNGAEVIVSTDVSCSLHLDSLARASEPRVPIVHVAELINEARKASEEGG